MEGDSAVALLFWSKTAGRSLECADTHYRGEERTSNISTFLASHGQYDNTSGPKFERKMQHSLFDLQYIFVVNYTVVIKKQIQHHFTLSRRRPVVAIPGKGVRCQCGQFGMRASPYAPPNIESLYPLFLKSKFFGGRRVRTAPFGTLALCFQITCKTSALVTINSRVQNFGSLLIFSIRS